MRVLNYRVILDPVEEGGFTVTVPSLPGCISEGETKEETLENIKDAIQGYLKVCKKYGDPIPKSDVLEEIVRVAVWKLPVVSGYEVGKVLKRIGYEFVDQEGSHLHYRKIYPPHIKITIPNHKELKRATLRSILRAADISVEKFKELL